MKKRFQYIETNETLCPATMLDPRIKNMYFKMP